MYYVYRISSSYDGFTPEKIGERTLRRKNNRYLIYSWNQYYDQLEKGDFVFTYFIGAGFENGIYLISKIVKLESEKNAEGKVIVYKTDTPLVTAEDFGKIKKDVFTRPRGSVFVVPPSREPFFEKILAREIMSDIEIFEKVDCKNCGIDFDFRRCPIFSRDYLINWDKEVNLNISGYGGIISPFWIIPRQSWWTRLSYGEHVISRIFYAFKAGYELYARLFAEGIAMAIEKSEFFRALGFDYITNIPLSPDKKRGGELDRVDVVCTILGSILKFHYVKDALILKKPISRRDYKRSGFESHFVDDYFRFLDWGTNIDFGGKRILIIDDVITDGKTLRTLERKFHEKYPDAHLCAATCGIMAKMGNMTRAAREKYEY